MAQFLVNHLQAVVDESFGTVRHLSLVFKPSLIIYIDNGVEHSLRPLRRDVLIFQVDDG